MMHLKKIFLTAVTLGGLSAAPALAHSADAALHYPHGMGSLIVTVALGLGALAYAAWDVRTQKQPLRLRKEARQEKQSQRGPRL